MRGSRASRGRRGVGSARAISNGNVPGGQIHDSGRNKERRNFAGPSLHELDVFAIDELEPTYAERHIAADFIEVRLLRLPRRHFNGKVRASQRELDEAAHFLEFFFFDPLEGVKVLYFACDFAIEVGGIKMRDAANTALPRDQIFPGIVGPNAQRADQSNACNDNSASQRSCSSVRVFG